MPSGHTHDRVTLWSLPVVAGLTFNQTRSSNLTLLVAGGFLLGGLMFGPDLDIYSRQYQRWGVLRWIWLPYQKSLHHRSLLSHGPLLGTTIRLVYFAIWVALLGTIGIGVWAAIRQMSGDAQNWQTLAARDIDGTIAWIERSRKIHLSEWLALFIGLELG
ncbi:MAG: metal-binding protein, partial [Geitlerinemataceae cyanobacterium]